MALAFSGVGAISERMTLLTARHPWDILGASFEQREPDRIANVGLGARLVVAAARDGGPARRERVLNEPQTVDRLDVRDLVMRGLGVVALLVIAFFGVSAFG
jgi:hypothetical protein